MINLKDESLKVLKNIYGNIKIEVIKVRKKLLLDSVLISLIDISSNNRYKILRKSAINKNRIPTEIVVELEIRNCIRDTDEVDKVTITSKGIWIVEDENTSLGRRYTLNEESLRRYAGDVLRLAEKRASLGRD